MDLRSYLTAVENRLQQLRDDRKEPERPIEVPINRRDGRLYAGGVFAVDDLAPDGGGGAQRDRRIEELARDVHVAGGRGDCVLRLANVGTALQQLARNARLGNGRHFHL